MMKFLHQRSHHPDSNIIGSLDEGLRLRKGNILLANHVTYHCYLAQFELKRVEEALQDENWVELTHEELNQFLALNNSFLPLLF